MYGEPYYNPYPMGGMGRQYPPQPQNQPQTNIIFVNGLEDVKSRLQACKSQIYCDNDKNIVYFKNKALEIRLYHILYGDKLCEKYARKWVEKLERNDGGRGEKWSVDQTESVRQTYDPHADKWEWYAVLNSIYADYYHDKFDNSIYYQLAKDFITDKDAVRDKVLAYYMYIVG